MKIAKAKNELSLIVELSKGSVMGLKSDLSSLNSYQTSKLKDFIASVLEKPRQPQLAIKTLNVYPQTMKATPIMKPVGVNRNYEV